MKPIYTEEILPYCKDDSNGQKSSHDFLFTRLTEFLKRVISLQQQDKQVENKDISDYITSSTQVGLIIKKFEAYKASHPKKFSDPNNIDLFSVYIHTTGSGLAWGSLLKFSIAILSSVGIMILDLITDMLKEFSGKLDQKVEICSLLLLILIVFVIRNIASTQFDWLSAKWKANTRTTLQYLVFSKLLRAQALTGKKKNEKNEEDKDNSKSKETSPSDEESAPDVNNIMTVDIDKQLSVFWAITESIYSITSIIVILLLLYQKIGSAIFQGLFVLSGAFIFNILITLALLYFNKAQLKVKDKRVALSKDVIEGMKSIKYLGWENIFKGKIDKIRWSEFKYASYTRVFDGILSVFWNCANYFLLFFFLIGFVDEGNDLRQANVFTIIALFGNLTSPIGILPWTFSYIVKMGVSYNRIKRFLNEKEIDYGKVTNFDITSNISDSQNPSKTTSNGSFLSDSQSQSSSFTASNLAIKIKSMRFTWPKVVGDPKKAKKQNKKQSKKDDILNEEESKSFERQLLDQDSFDQSSTNGQEMFQLKISDVQIYKGDLAVVIGKIGSGKSAFLNAILNELDGSSDNSRESLIFEENGQTMESFDKKIILNGSTAYVSQNHWLQNKTVRDNILFGEEFDKQWYDTVVEAADLKTDFNTFAKGDLKVIGPGGGNLSGGQKQRISICRALYAKKDIYLLDDIFSSLDAHVAEKIYQSAILELLIKKLKKTVILVTSHFGIFTDMAKISQIIYFDRGSVVKEQTLIDEFIKYGLSEEQEEEISKKKQELDHFIEDIDNEENDSLLNGSVSDQLTDVSNDHKDNIASIFSDGQYQKLDKKEPLILVKSKSKDKKKQDDSNEEDNEEEEKRVKGGIKLETFKTYFESMGWGFLLIFFTANLIMEASQMMIDFWLRDYVNPTSQFFADINEYFGSFKATFVFFIVANITLTTFRAVFYCICAILSGKRLFDRLNKSLIFSNMKFYDQNPVGRIVNRLSEDIVTIDDVLPWTCHVLLENVAYSLGYPLGVIIQFPSLIFLAIIAVMLIYFVQKLYRSSNREVRRLNSVNSGKVLSVIGEACKGIIQIRSFNKEQFLLKEYLSKLDAGINTFLLNQAIEIWMTIRLLLISNIVFAFVAVTSVILVVFDFSFDVSSISMCLTYSMLLSGRFAELMYFFCSVEQNMVSVERVRQYFDNDQEKPDELIVQKQGSNVPVVVAPATGANSNTLLKESPSDQIAIEFKNVYITYDNIQDKHLTKDTNDVQFALKDVSIQIKKGEKIAFCGRTGSGKTSILNSLYGMYPIQFGEISVHGKNISSYSLRQLRDQMSIIPQFGFLYNETLQRNLDPDDQISKYTIQERIHASNLHIRDHHYGQKKSKSSNGHLHKEITATTNGAIPVGAVSLNIPHKNNSNIVQDDLSFMIENGGENLSNGEKQIVNFFRVILRDIDIICLDEASSNMDPKTDAMLHEQIFKFAKDKTLVVITHRLENIDLFDRVVVMDKGQIVECGPVEELRQAKGGFFNKLIKHD